VDSSCKKNVSQHLSSKNHKNSAQNLSQKQKSVPEMLEKRSEKQEQNADLMELFLGLDIPLGKMDTDLWKKWAKKYLTHKVPHRSTLMENHLPDMHEKVLIF